ncbi:hypothetical protein M0804_008321 [Polistes exclamans]|nr:hypothetical protein M0804_008321 [Polistes exclamans]
MRIGNYFYGSRRGAGNSFTRVMKKINPTATERIIKMDMHGERIADTKRNSSEVDTTPTKSRWLTNIEYRTTPRWMMTKHTTQMMWRF